MKYLYRMNISSNYVSDIIDEIALEGLDGITLEALWKRLSVRPNFCLKIDEKSKNFIWGLCTQLSDLKYFELPEKRPPLKYYDLPSLQKEQQEANIELDQLYPYQCIKSETEIFGSCKLYSTRKDVTCQVIHMNLHTVEELYPDTLVVVASQESRYLALLGTSCPPNLDFSKSRVQYDILERIGRSRNIGVSTHGKGSLQSIVDDCKSIFHYLKILMKHKAIKKQSLVGSLQTNPNGSKVYLMRFYGEYMNEYQFILQTAIEELKCRPNYRMPYEDFYQLFDPDKRSRVQKYSKTSQFKKYIMVSKPLPYRELFPNSTPAEWERKCQGGEKTVRVFQLLDPNTEVTDVSEKDCDSEDEDAPSDFLAIETYYKNLPLLHQTYHHIKSSDAHGITIRELSEIMGLSRSFIRSLVKRLIQDKHCKYFEEINGRRHTKRYMVGENAKNIAAASEILQILSENNVKGDPAPNLENDVSRLNEETNLDDEAEMEKKMEFHSLEEENMPYRTLRRIGMIIKTIKAHRYRLFHQIYRHVLDEEIKEGLRATACRMTIIRILQKLEKDGLIKIVDLTKKDGNNGSVGKLYMEPMFVLDESLTEKLLHTHLTYKSFDLTKGIDDENTQLERYFGEVLLENLAEMKKMLMDIKFKRGKIVPKKSKKSELTCSPKFVRLNIIHDFMFYLVYNYTGVTDRPQEELLQELAKVCEIDDDLKKEMPNIYGTQLSSYLFVPPLKERDGILSGWFLMSDLLIRLPLSIFVKIVRISETTPELQAQLNHPIRKHFLVKDMPPNVRSTLFSRLQCLSAFSNDIKRLCFLGLVQFGGKCGKEQYQTLLYLNRNASILDTTSSPPAYVYVPSEINFPIQFYKFENRADVKKYWQNLCEICLGTNLGVRANMIGKEVVTARELGKESLKKYVEAKTPSKALADDDGTIPGDHLGAGGVDSVMFSFLRCNWIGPITKWQESSKVNTLKKVPLQRLKKDLAKKKQRIRIQKSRLKRLFKKPEVLLPKPILHEGNATSKRMRKIKEREMKYRKERKAYYDEVDMEALKLKNSLRVTWSPAEDHLLLICHVAMLYLCPAPRGLVRIPWSEVRCCLQKNLVEARNKTQKAIARRVKYMLKNQTTGRSVHLCLQELNQIPEVAERFSSTDLMKSIKPSTPNLTEIQSELYQKFHDLIDYIRERFSKGAGFSVEETNEDLLPDTLEVFKDIYGWETESTKEPLMLKNIRESVIRAILMSSLSCRADKTSSAIQLFDIYRQYEDDELQKAIKKLNADKVLTVKKVNNTTFRNGRYLPLSQSPCKLSFSFQNLLNVKYSHNLYPESFNLISKLRQTEGTEGCPIDLNDCNIPLYILACNNLITFRTTIPDQIIVLDSGSSMNEDAYAKMVQRYCEMLQFSKSDSKFVCTSGKLLTTVSSTNKRSAPSMSEEEEPTKRIKLEPGESMQKYTESESVNCDVSETTGEHGGSWRVVLYMMREEAKKEINNFTGNRSQDFFVVNASQVSCQKMDGLEFYAKEMDPKVVTALIRNILSRHSVPLSLVPEESVYKEFEKQHSDELLSAMKSVLDFIYQRREFGVSSVDLRLNFSMEILPMILRHLVDSKIVIKTGIDETRYVGQKYSTPWLLNSFKVTRLEREKMKPSELNAVELKEDGSPCGDEGPSSVKRKKKGVITSEDLKSSDYTPPPCSMEQNNKVKMIIRPWIRIDGSLNRKVLDRFLGTILGYIMVNPGITIRQVMDKFAPSFLPIWTKDLIEILHNIGCVSFMSFVVKKKSTLFSEQEITLSDGYTGLDDDNSVIVEAKIDAITTLGLFIGKRSYSKDFLMD